MLKLIKLKKNYKMGKEVVHALDGINFSVEKGAFVSIMGPSGSGKSTLLNMIGCLDKPSEGKVILNGEDITAFKGRKLTNIRGKKVGFIFQDFDLIPTLTALENVILPLKYQGFPKAKRKKRATSALEKVGLKNRLRHRPTQLSGGEQQRVAIARALVTQPDIIVADEPTGELDSKTSQQILSLLKQINEEIKTTFIFVTHDPEVAKQTKRQYRMKDGKLRADTRR